MITYDKFCDGMLEALDYKVAELSKDQKKEICKEIEEKWWFCGGRDTRSDATELYSHGDEGEQRSICQTVLDRWEKLWKHYFGERMMPTSSETCLCKQGGLRYNCYITDGTRILTIGRICMIQFLPNQADGMNSKRCERCMKPHKNRKDNFCSSCRVLNAKEEAEEKERVRLEEEEMARAEAEERERVRLESVRVEREQANERLRVRLETLRQERERQAVIKAEEAERMARQCGCGGWKKPEYPSCWNCRQKKMNGMTEMEKKKCLCVCGKTKQPQFAKCFTCNKGNPSDMIL